MDGKHGTIVWTELMTRDADRAMDFYGALCGWSFAPMSADSSYYIASKDGAPVAGIFGLGDDVPPEAAERWFTHIAVDDVDAAAAQTRDAGGAIHKAPWDIPGVGRVAIVADPTGASFGLLTPES